MEPKANRTNGSYHQILKSTSILGLSSAINIILRIIRTKFLAILLGTSGIGLLGIYYSITEMAGGMARMGIDNSGVRQTAGAAGTGDVQDIGRTLFILRWVSLFLGLFGMIMLILLSSHISRLTFENEEYTSDLILLSVIILFEVILSGEVARIQGMRKIGDLAKVNILGALFGTILSIPIIYFWGRKGIVPFLIAASGMSVLSAWWYASKIKVPRVKMRWIDVRAEVKLLLSLGSVFMAGDVMAKGTGYLVRVLVARQLSLEAVGLYHAAMTLSTVYVGFILDSMFKDYYPRLTAIANNDPACNELVNQQIEVGILLSIPGILATLTFGPIILHFFYTAKFIAAFEVLRWQVLGMLLVVVSWPMLFVLQAKGLGKLFFFTEVVKNVIYCGLIWAGVSYLGLSGTGVAFFGMSAFYLIMIHSVASHLTGFTWSRKNIRNAILILPAIAIVFVSDFCFGRPWGLILSSAVSIAITLFSIKSLCRMINRDGLPPLFAKVKVWLQGRPFSLNRQTIEAKNQN